MKKLWIIVFASAVSAALAYNHVDPASVVWTQERSGVVSIAYTLAGAPAYVTIDVLTNGVSVGSAESAGYSGDVNGIVQPGSHLIVWHMQDENLKHAKIPEGGFSVRFSVRNANRLPDYMAVKLDDGSVAFYDSTNAVPNGVGAAQWKTTHMLFRRIPAANVSARLGLGLAERAGYNNVPAYVRTFEEDYYLAVYEMTQGQYMALGNANPSSCGQTSFANLANATHRTLHETDWSWHPVDTVNYDQAMTAGTTLSTRSANGNGYGFTFTLPNEDQWEYACRAGCSQDIYTGARYNSYYATVNSVYVNFQTAQSYYGGTQANGYHPQYADQIAVGQLTPNAWGLYDMLGNVRECCVTTRGGTAVLRGGGSTMSGENMTAACRELVATTFKDGQTGFRLVCNLNAE
jgi:formylglycine-generating enzyme required for sulfatase activity